MTSPSRAGEGESAISAGGSPPPHADNPDHAERADRGDAGWVAPARTADGGVEAGWGAPSKVATAGEDAAGWDRAPSKPAAAGEDTGAWGFPSQGGEKNAGWNTVPSAPRSPPASSEGPQRPVLFVNNLSTETENRDLEEVFGKFGNVKKVSIMYDPHSRESRGFAFVDFETVEEAQKAVNGIADLTLHGRQIHAELARRGRPRTPTPGRYCGMPKRAPRGPPPGRNDNYGRSSFRDRSPDYRGDSHRRDYDAPRDRDRDRDRYGGGSGSGSGRSRDYRESSSSYPRDSNHRDQYNRDPYSSRSGGGGGYDRRSPAFGESSSRHDRRGGSPPPKTVSRYDRY